MVFLVNNHFTLETLQNLPHHSFKINFKPTIADSLGRHEMALSAIINFVFSTRNRTISLCSKTKEEVIIV